MSTTAPVLAPLPRSISRAAAVALEGLAGRIVEIEAALTNQTPGLKLVGLPTRRCGRRRRASGAPSSTPGSTCRPGS